MPRSQPVRSEEELFAIFGADGWSELAEVLEERYLFPHVVEFERGLEDAAVMNSIGYGQGLDLAFPFTRRHFVDELLDAASAVTELLHFMPLRDRAEEAGGLLAVTVADLCLGCRFGTRRPRKQVTAAQANLIVDTLRTYGLESTRLPIPVALSDWTVIYLSGSPIAREMQRHDVATWPNLAATGGSPERPMERRIQRRDSRLRDEGELGKRP